MRRSLKINCRIDPQSFSPTPGLPGPDIFLEINQCRELGRLPNGRFWNEKGE